MPYFLVIRSQRWDDTPELQYRETRKCNSMDHALDAVEDFQVMVLGHVVKNLAGTRTLIETVQSVYEYLPNGCLEYVDCFSHKLPPLRKVKVINNRNKPQATWLSSLENNVKNVPPAPDPYEQPANEFNLDNEF